MATKELAKLRAEPRSETGKSAARQIRREGRLPAVVYGHGDESRPLTIDSHEFDRLMSRIHAATTVIELDIDGGEPEQVLIREIQRHPFRSEVLHVDFFHIRADEVIRVSVPVHLLGHPTGVEEGGILQQTRHEIEIECLPSDIPSEFTVDVSALEIGDSIHIADIDTGTVTILDEADLTVCSVVPPTVIEVEEEPEEELEPELVGVEGEEGEEPEEGEERAEGRERREGREEGGGRERRERSAEE